MHVYIVSVSVSYTHFLIFRFEPIGSYIASDNSGDLENMDKKVIMSFSEIAGFSHILNFILVMISL